MGKFPETYHDPSLLGEGRGGTRPAEYRLLTLSLPKWPKANFDQISKFHFLKF